MAANLEDQLIDKVRALPTNKQQEALRLLDTLAGEPGSEPHGTGVDRRPIWEIVEEVNAPVTRRHVGERRERTAQLIFASDGSINLDHYLYGAPNRIGEQHCGFQRSN